jgi:small subunit ribosomal protein S1
VPREERERRRREALAGLVVGEWREGKVTGIAPFGAFVDLGGVDGLVHVSQLGTGGFVERVEDVVQVGQVVRVRVAEVDMDRGRVSLSMREPRPAAPSRDRGAAPPPAARPPRPAPSAGGFTPSWTPEPAPEGRHDRRSRGGERSGPGRGEERGPRRSERSRRHRDGDEEDWRSVRGDPRNYYSYGEEDADEPAPTTAEELVARFNRRSSGR